MIRDGLYSDTLGVSHWPSIARDMRIRQVKRVRTPVLGSQPQEYGSPYWSFRMNWAALTNADLRELESAIADNEGLAPFLVYDRMRPFPLWHMHIHASTRLSTIDQLYVSAISKSAKTVTVYGAEGTVICAGDPFAFEYQGKRYYNRAKSRVVISGASAVPVQLRPSVSAEGIGLKLERVRPAGAFMIDVDGFFNSVSSQNGKLHSARLDGIEWTGAY